MSLSGIYTPLAPILGYMRGDTVRRKIQFPCQTTAAVGCRLPASNSLAPTSMLLALPRS